MAAENNAPMTAPGSAYAGPGGAGLNAMGLFGGLDPSAAAQQAAARPATRLDAVLSALPPSKPALYRVVVVSALHPNLSANSATQYYQQLLKNLQAQIQQQISDKPVVTGLGGAAAAAASQADHAANAVTGILLVTPQHHAIHLLEGPHTLVYQVLSDLARTASVRVASPLHAGEDALGGTDGLAAVHGPSASDAFLDAEGNLTMTPQTPGDLFSSSRIAALLDDAPSRAFPYWLSRAADPGRRSAAPHGGGGGSRVDPLTAAANAMKERTAAAAAAAAAATAAAAAPAARASSDARPGSGGDGAEGDPDASVSVVLQLVTGLDRLGQRLGSVPKTDLKGFLDDVLVGGTGGGGSGATPFLPPPHALAALLEDVLLDSPADWAREHLERREYNTATSDLGVWPAPKWAFLQGVAAVAAAMESRERGPGSSLAGAAAAGDPALAGGAAV
ncbi:hypothetical protein BC828DRAFT_373416 [Blastocladiella britannica]|nr:hypothetical protein BC828DRAFT_373416 [Blastocladiella britannica]